jgi:hypothetical protein
MTTAPTSDPSTTPTDANASPSSAEETKPSLPDRLAVDSRSPHYRKDVLEHAIGIRFNGVDRNDVEEYCVSEGWVKVAVGNKVDRRGNPLTIKLKGEVSPYYRAPE